MRWGYGRVIEGGEQELDSGGDLRCRQLEHRIARFVLAERESGSRIGNAPVGGLRLTDELRADLTHPITHRYDTVEPLPFELVEMFRTVRRQVDTEIGTHHSHSVRMHWLRLAAGTVGLDRTIGVLAGERLSDLGSGAVTGAHEQHPIRHLPLRWGGAAIRRRQHGKTRVQVSADRAEHRTEPSEIDAVVRVSTIGGASTRNDKSHLTQFSEVVRNEVLRLIEQVGEFADGVVAPGEVRQQAPAQRVARKLKERSGGEVGGCHSSLLHRIRLMYQAALLDRVRDVTTEPPSRLDRRLGVADAITIGLGSMIGAGVFTVLGPAAEVAGSGLLIGLGIAGLVACCNAASSAQLAAVHPASGGTYVYGREQLGHVWGFLAGWGFVVGKTASCAAMALTFANYVAHGAARPVAVGAVVALTAVNLAGVQKTSRLTRLLVIVVVAALAVTLVAATSGDLSWSRLGPIGIGGASGILESAGILFFAFAGYARIATLGEEVRNPQLTIPRAIPIALGITLAIYAAVAVVSLTAIGPNALAATSTPLVSVANAGRLDGGATVIRVGAAVGALSVLLSLLVGVSRTTFAMAAERDLPSWLASVDPMRKVPRRAEVAVAGFVIVVVLVADVRSAIGFSSFGVLAYYAIANASAWTLTAEQRRWPRSISAVGLVGCIIVAGSLPTASVLSGLAVWGTGAVVWCIRQVRSG